MRASSAPVMTPSPSSRRMPTRRAIVSAVRGWSPVIMTGRMPAWRHSATASSASGRGGSIMPTMPMRVRPASAVSGSRGWGTSSQTRIAKPRVRSPSAAMRPETSSTSLASIAWVPAPLDISVQRSTRTSIAPLVNDTTRPSCQGWKVVMRFRPESKGSSARRGKGASRAAGV